MRIWIVYSTRQCSGHYTKIEMVTTSEKEAMDCYNHLKAGGGDQSDYPSFDIEYFDLPTP